MVDLSPDFESRDTNGSTVHDNGTVGTSNVAIPAANTKVISEFIIECMESNVLSQTLLVSLDGGTNYKKFQPGDTFHWSPKGNVTKINIKGGATGVAYEAIFNLEPV